MHDHFLKTNKHLSTSMQCHGPRLHGQAWILEPKEVRKNTDSSVTTSPVEITEYVNNRSGDSQTCQGQKSKKHATFDIAIEQNQLLRRATSPWFGGCVWDHRSPPRQQPPGRPEIDQSTRARGSPIGPEGLPDLKYTARSSISCAFQAPATRCFPATPPKRLLRVMDTALSKASDWAPPGVAWSCFSLGC